jgi:hypothetical protein
MKELPKYGFLTSGPGFEGIKVIQLERPYLIASIYEVKTHDAERVNQFLEDMAQERFPISKVKGFTVFLKLFSSLEPNNNREFQQAVLNEMADFVLTERIQVKPGQFRKCDDTERSAKYCEKVKREEIRLRHRKHKTNE